MALMKKYTEFRKDDRPAGRNGWHPEGCAALRCGEEEEERIPEGRSTGKSLLTQARGTGFSPAQSLGPANSLSSQKKEEKI